MEYNHNDYADLIGTFMMLLLLMLLMLLMLLISLVLAVCCCFYAETLLMLFFILAIVEEHNHNECTDVVGDVDVVVNTFLNGVWWGCCGERENINYQTIFQGTDRPSARTMIQVRNLSLQAKFRYIGIEDINVSCALLVLRCEYQPFTMRK